LALILLGLAGAAWFVYVANSQGKPYFTYNGGPVFGLSSPEPTKSARQ
jgi:hypothetical protein